MKTPAPPRRPGPRAGLYELIDYLADMAEYLGTSVIAAQHTERLHMAQADNFQGGLDRNTAATSAAGAAITAEIAQLKAAIEALSTTAAPTQAQLDQLNAASQALEDATASLVADDAPAA